MTLQIHFIDTSVLVEILDVPMMSSDHAAFMAEFRERVGLGHRFVIPATTIIETGNHIAQVNGDRYGAAQRFAAMLSMAIDEIDPFAAMELEWDRAFVRAVLDGASTGEPLTAHAAASRLGAGDLAIVAQRDRFLERSNFDRGQVKIWTKEVDLETYA